MTYGHESSEGWGTAAESTPTDRENLRATIQQVFDDHPIEREFAVDEFIDLLVDAISPDASQPREAVRGSSRQVGARVEIDTDSTRLYDKNGCLVYEDGWLSPAVGHESACSWQVGRPEEICTCPPVVEYDSELGGSP